MATKQNGVLGSFTPTVTPYTNDTRPANSLAVAATEFPFYTCPGGTMVSAKLVISNNTGGAAAVDIGIVEQTDVIQLDAPGSQPGAPSNYLGFSFPVGQYTSSIYLDGGNVSGSFTPGEVLSWTNPAMSTPAQTAIVQAWDASNSRLWVRGLSDANALYPASGDITYTGAGGGSISSGVSYAGSGTTRGNSGRIKFFDNLRGLLYFDNHEFRNNLDYSLAKFRDINQEVRELDNNNLNRSHLNRHRPVATTVDRIAASNTTPTTEFVDANGVELLVSGVSMIQEHQYLVKQKSINDADIFELGGIVLGQYQSIYVKSSAAVTATLIGFEETAEVAS
jgi:hypothetical protein|tara:strand:+ start:168 stop:1175 length:1008 start_codon:yes stop_codon:yes gene_type:complete